MKHDKLTLSARRKMFAKPKQFIDGQTRARLATSRRQQIPPEPSMLLITGDELSRMIDRLCRRSQYLRQLGSPIPFGGGGEAHEDERFRLSRHQQQLLWLMELVL